MIYREMRKELEQERFIFLAIVIDGKRGVREVFSDIHAQMCHFHQRQILKRCLTSKIIFNDMSTRVIVVNDLMQKGYRYECTEPIGENFDPEFRPDLTPKEMLAMGVFGGKYMTDCRNEFPSDWFDGAKLSLEQYDPKLNFFGVLASQPLSKWRKKGWIYKDDPRGWFQWYCRYYMGRRIPMEDNRQIKRWKAFSRHVAQIAKSCRSGDFSCRPRQRQALLHWAYDSRLI